MSDYEVVLLIEQAFTKADAANVRSLHDEIAETVHYYVLLPVEDASARVESAMGALGAGEVMVTPTVGLSESDLEDIRRELLDNCREGVNQTVKFLREAGAEADGEPVTIDPIRALVGKVSELDAREVIILTRPHVVSEFFHVDWTSKARRKLGVPVLHLLEHENFDEQAGEGEGINGF
jgi:hypothetical protein